MEKSILDSELIAMSARLQAGMVNAAPATLENLGVKMRGAGVNSEADLPAQESNSVAIKLVVNPESKADVSDWLESTGSEVVSIGSNVLIANVDVAYLSDMQSVAGIRRVEASKRLEMRMEDARGTISGADAAISTHGLTGDGVVVGIIDSGVDWTQSDFIDNSSATRIKRFIHAHRSPSGSTSVYDYYNESDINSALGGGTSIPTGDPHGHGTHCAGIAAGNGRASSGQYIGIAPNSTIMAMRSDLFDDEIITGIRDFFDQAGDGPAVINLSLGTHFGAHDGTSAIENVIANETGNGRIIVVAAGNEGADNIHWSGELVQGQTLTMDAVVQDATFQFVDVWIPRGDDIDVELEYDGGHIVPLDGLYHNTPLGRVGGVVRIDAINNDQNITLFFDGCTVGSNINLRLAANVVTQGMVHAWAGGGDGPRNVFPGGSNDFSIGMPATEESAISVGSLVSRNSIHHGGAVLPGVHIGERSMFSSFGPTRDERQKPDIAAPGQYITSSLASNSLMSTSPRYAQFRHSNSNLISIQGTSMATPFIVGVIALMLEREPTLDPNEIKQRIRATATRDLATGRVWNNGFGLGRINVEALLDYPN